MTETVKLMTDLLAFEIAGKPLDSGCIMSDDQLKILYKMSRAHDVAHLVGDALIKNNLVSGEYKEKFSKCVIAAVFRYEKQKALNTKVWAHTISAFFPLRECIWSSITVLLRTKWFLKRTRSLKMHGKARKTAPNLNTE